MSNHYEELMHFVSGNTRNVVCRNWANDLRKLDEARRQRDSLRAALDRAADDLDMIARVENNYLAKSGAERCRTALNATEGP